MDENYIRRERQRREEIKREVEKMRAALKICTLDDIRRYKLPFAKALIIGLEEKGYFFTATFIQQMIDFQTEMREKVGPLNIFWTKPQLRDNNNILKTISDNLMKVETFRKMKEHEKECETFLKTSIHFAFLSSDWWWLGERMLLHSINLANDYPSLEGKYEALSRYAYAKFLMENTRKIKSAHGHLTIVRELSKGKKWMTMSLFPDEKDYLYVMANKLLHICLMQEARSYLQVNFIKAIKLANSARKRAAEACDLDGETRALFLKGICELNVKRTSVAIATFTKAFYIQTRLGNLEGMCTAQIHLAQAYLVNGDTLQSLKTLLISRDCAKENNLSYYLAQAYKHLGEFYLNNGEARKATPLLDEALKILHDIDNVLDIEQVRNLGAISAGLELFPKFLKLLSDISHPVTGLENLMKLVDWKDSRKQFWSQDDEYPDPSSESSDKSLENDQVSLDDSCNTVNALYDDGIVKLHDNNDTHNNTSNTELLVCTEEQFVKENESVSANEEALQKESLNSNKDEEENTKYLPQI